MAKNKKRKNTKITAPQTNTRVEKQKTESGRPRTKKTWLLAALMLFLALAGAAAFWFVSRSGNLTAGAYKDYNVLFITLDTLRADHLPMYGYTKVKTPNLDRLADKSYLFEDAISHVPLTLPSHTSMFTGLLPIGHGVRDNAGYFVDLEKKTLAEILKEKGYATGAFVSSFVLNSRWQLNQGFDFYYDNFNLAEFKKLNAQDAQRPAADTAREVMHWLEENKQKRFFCWAHFYDPHDPYEPPEPYKTEYADRPYDGEIAYMDEHVGKLLAKLEELKVQDRTIIVMTGDHGESLGEHKEITHAMFVYNTTQHVPLLIRLPNASGRSIKDLVQHIDLAPTILDLLGIKAFPEMQGKSLLPLMNGKKDSKRMVFSESIYSELHYGWSPLQSLTTDAYKYIEAPKAELYDRNQDPNELRNLITEKASIAKVLKSELQTIVANFSGKNLKGPHKMDPETEEKLRALGYIGSIQESTPESRKIDPKDKIHLAQNTHIAFAEAQKKNHEAALQIIRPVLEEDPTMTDAHFVAGVSYLGLKQYDKALDELLKTLSLRAEQATVLFNLGCTYEAMENLKEAESWFLKVIQNEPDHLQTNLKLGHLYRRTNRPQLASMHFQKAVKSYEEFLEQSKGDETRSEIMATIGEIEFAAGNLEEAERRFRAAAELTPNQSTIHYNLAQIYEAQGDMPAAIIEYQAEIRVDSKNFKAFNDLGLLYRKAGQFEDAALCFQKVVELAPEDPRGYLLLAMVYKNMGRGQEAMQIMQRAPRQQELNQLN
jgi:arylsulfatase A-like enzyme/Tfp pilus assembly protein PilF